MITEIFEGFEFENAGIECICQSINALYGVFESSAEILKDDILFKEITAQEVWSHNYVLINTSFILIHQGLEAFLKWKICEESPLLLLDKPRKEWPTLPKSKEVKFKGLHHVGGEDLVKTFFAVNKDQRLNSSVFFDLVDNIRIVRNEIIHIRPKDNIRLEECLRYALEVLTAFYGKDKWLIHLRDQHLKNPLLGLSNSSFSAAFFYKKITFLMETLGKSRLNKHLSMDLKARKYCCPKCTYDLYNVGEEIDKTKLSFLKPNLPESKVIFCHICGDDYNVEREDCPIEGCKGNVISHHTDYGSYCLTCYNML